MNSTLRAESPLVNEFLTYLEPYLEGMTKPTRENCELLCAGMLVTGSLSIRKCHDQVIRLLSPKQLKTFYYMMADKAFRRNRQLPADRWPSTTLSKALAAIPEEAEDYPIFLIVDDTLVQKFGSHFFGIQTHHDHSSHRQANFLDGHCFVTLLALVPVKVAGKITYTPVIVEHCMYDKDSTESKLVIANHMVTRAMKTIGSVKKTALLCDSWYPKGDVLKLLSGHKNLSLLCNVRIDSVMYHLPPEEQKGPGRRRKRGDRVRPGDFELTHVPGTNIHIGSMQVLTNLFGEKVIEALVTRIGKKGTNRVYFATDPSIFEIFCRLPELLPAGDAQDVVKANANFAPYAVYLFRWTIETVFQQLKDSWAFCEYKVRSGGGINRLLNLQAALFSTLSLLPALDERFASLAEMSIQERRSQMGHLIMQEIFLRRLRLGLETGRNSPVYQKACSTLLSGSGFAA